MMVRRQRYAASRERFMKYYGKSMGVLLSGMAMRCASAAGAGIVAAILLAGGGQKNPGGPPAAMPVTVVEVRPTDVPLTGEWVGTLDGYVNAQIQPQANGYLVRQVYREGAVVAQGQVLFEIDPRPFVATLDQAKGQLAQA